MCIRRLIPCVLSVCSWDGNLYSFPQHNGMHAMNMNEERFRGCSSILILSRLSYRSLLWSSSPSFSSLHRHCRYFRPAKTRSHNNRDVCMRGSKTCQTVQVMRADAGKAAGKTCKGCRKTELPFCTPIFDIWDFLFDLFSARFESTLKIKTTSAKTEYTGRQKKKKIERETERKVRGNRQTERKSEKDELKITRCKNCVFDSSCLGISECQMYDIWIVYVCVV